MNTVRDITSKAFNRWIDGSGYISEIFADNLQWEIVGRSEASKTYNNKQQFLDEVLHPFAVRFSKDKPFKPTKIRGLYVDGNTAVVFFDGRGTTIKDTLYENTYAWFLTFENELVVNGTAFYDSIAFNELWDQIPLTR